MVTEENNVVSENKDQAEGSSEVGKNSTPDTNTPVSTESQESSPESPNDKTKEPETAGELKKLQDDLKLAEEKAANHWEELLRAKADLENTRKRLERDVQNAHKYAVEKFVQDLLPVIDSLEMGVNAANEINTDIQKVKEGTELTLKMFNDCAKKFGVEAVDPTGQPFNPEFHQAMSIQESNDHEPDTIIAVMQKGYLLNGRLVRPAMVVVAKASSNPASKKDDNSPNNNEDKPADKEIKNK